MKRSREFVRRISRLFRTSKPYFEITKVTDREVWLREITDIWEVVLMPKGAGAHWK